MLGRFQNSSVPVLNFKIDPVPVSVGSSIFLTLGSGSRGFGSSVLTVLNFTIQVTKNLVNFAFQ